MDWKAVETEYITTDTSYRKLAKKYGVNQATISRKGKEEDWVGKKERYTSEVQAKTIDALGDQAVDRAKRFQDVADKLLDKIDAVLDAVEPTELPAKSIRALTAAVRDLQEIQGIKPDLDKQEQEARIAKLRKEADKDTTEKASITVTLAGGLADYAQ